MIVKALFTAAALALLPAFAAASAHASCTARGYEAQSCAKGSTWDAAKQTCVKVVNG